MNANSIALSYKNAVVAIARLPVWQEQMAA
jgi:hypothetical protein